MRIHSKTVIDIETSTIVEDLAFEYEGPIALCDRSLQRQAQSAATTAGATSSNLFGQGAEISGNIVPTLERYTTTPPGYSPMDLATMQTRAEEGAAASTGRATEEAKLRSLRTRNIAGLGSEETAIAEGAARGEGATIQDILARNAELKERQRGQAFGELGNIYRTDLSIGAEQAGQQAGDIELANRLKGPGFLGVLNTLASLGGRR